MAPDWHMPTAWPQPPPVKSMASGLPSGPNSGVKRNKVLRSDELRKRYAAEGAEAGGGTPAELAIYLKNDYERWGRVVKAAGIKPE